MTRATWVRLGAAAVLATAVTTASAGTITLQPVKDNTLFSTTDTSSGMGVLLFSGRTGSNGGGTMLRAVMAFDVACGGVPAGSTIMSATLSLTLRGSSAAGSPQIHTVHRIRADWGEGTSVAPGGVGGPATTDDATWLHTYFPTDVVDLLGLLGDWGRCP